MPAAVQLVEFRLAAGCACNRRAGGGNLPPCLKSGKTRAKNKPILHAFQAFRFPSSTVASVSLTGIWCRAALCQPIRQAPTSPRRAPADPDQPECGPITLATSVAITAVSRRNQHIAHKLAAANALDRRGGKSCAKCCIIEIKKFGYRWRDQIGPGLQLYLARHFAANLFHGQAARQSSQP